MINTSAYAWVLHKRWSGDTSAHVTFFTREEGLVSALCKGGRTPKKQALLQAFIPLWVGLDERHGWHYVRQLEIASPSLCLTGENLFAGLYLNELLFHVLHPQDPDDALYSAYEQALRELSVVVGRLAVEVVLRRFEWELLLACGHQISFTHDPHSGEPIMAANHYTFIAGDGFILADKGVSGAHILALAAGDLDDRSVLKAAKWVMRRAIDHVLGGKRLKARELYSR